MHELRFCVGLEIRDSLCVRNGRVCVSHTDIEQLKEGEKIHLLGAYARLTKFQSTSEKALRCMLWSLRCPPESRTRLINSLLFHYVGELRREVIEDLEGDFVFEFRANEQAIYHNSSGLHRLLSGDTPDTQRVIE